jgi:hypothetical protein
LLAAAIWHNILQPLNVSGETGGSVDPLDVLTIVNEINSPKFSDPTNGTLPFELPDGTSNPFLDIDCDSRVTPLDVLSVINAINTGSYAPDWVFSETGSNDAANGRVTNAGCFPKLIEGNSLHTALSQTITVPDSTSAVRVSFETPVFDTFSKNAFRDSFEIVVLDQNGQPIVLPYAWNRDASFNWSEAIGPIVSSGSTSTTQGTGSISSATFPLVGLQAGTRIEVRARLVNNDNDSNTGVVIRGVEVVDFQGAAPTGMSVPTSQRIPQKPFSPEQFVDVTSSVQLDFGRTTLVDNISVVVADLQVKNLNASAISSDMVLVVDGLSNAELSLLQPDGYYGAGVPYLMLRGNGNDRWLASGQSTEFRELRFKNPNKTQFQASFRVLAKINLPPAEFDASPLLEIEAGRAYESSVRTSDPDQQSLTYSKVVGPAGMAIDPSSGVILWPTSTLDTGNHSVKIRATDPFGLYVDLTFSIAVTSSLPNRPPVFTSTPPTEAIVEQMALDVNLA